MKIFQTILIALVASTSESNADAAKDISTSVTDGAKQDSSKSGIQATVDGALGEKNSAQQAPKVDKETDSTKAAASQRHRRSANKKRKQQKALNRKKRDVAAAIKKAPKKQGEGKPQKKKLKLHKKQTTAAAALKKEQDDGKKRAIAGISCATLAVIALIAAIKLCKKKSAEVEEDHEEEV